MEIEDAKQLKKGDRVFYAGSFYEFAEIKEFPHGISIGIYDEPPTKHIDYLNPNSVKRASFCGNCQNGCPVCGGFGLVVLD